MLLDRREIRAYALLGLVIMLWAGNSIVGRAVRFDVPPLTLAFVRWFGASLILLPFAWEGLRRDWPELRANWKPVLVLGLLGIGAFNSLLYSGLQYTPATNALLLQAAIPFAVMVLDRILHRVTSPLLQKIGVGLSVLGVAAIVFEGDPQRALALQFGRGDLLILGSVLVWAFYTVGLRYRPQVSATSFVAATFLVGVAANAPFALNDWLRGAHIVWSAKVVGAFAYVCVLPSILSYFIYNHATGIIGPARAGQSLTLMPIFGALLSAALLGEMLYSYHFAGMAFILGGIALAALAGRGQRTGAAPKAPLEDRA